jgi:hypothetical protein
MDPLRKYLDEQTAIQKQLEEARKRQTTVGMSSSQITPVTHNSSTLASALASALASTSSSTISPSDFPKPSLKGSMKSTMKPEMNELSKRILQANPHFKTLL